MSRESIIADKCEQAGCDKSASSYHAKLFSESWDVHPPQGFVSWWHKHPEARKCKAITAWNTDRNRRQFWNYENGVPEAGEEILSPEEIERGNVFMDKVYERRESPFRLGHRQT